MRALKLRCTVQGWAMYAVCAVYAMYAMCAMYAVCAVYAVYAMCAMYASQVGHTLSDGGQDRQRSVAEQGLGG